MLTADQSAHRSLALGRATVGEDGRIEARPAEIVAELGEDVARDYVCLSRLPDGRIVGVHRLIYHWTLHVGIDRTSIEERYCYHSVASAMIDCWTWDGSGDPAGSWHRHPSTDRYRDPDTGETWTSRQPPAPRSAAAGAAESAWGTP